MNFLGSLGVDPKLLIAQIINFAILLLILKALVYKPLLKRIEEDEEKLKEAQTMQQELEQERQALLLQKSQQEQELKLRSDKIIEEAEQVANDIKLRAQAESEKEKENIISQIKSRLSNIEYETGK